MLVECVRFDGTPHGFFSRPDVLDAAGDAQRVVVEVLRAAFAKQPRVGDESIDCSIRADFLLARRAGEPVAWERAGRRALGGSMTRRAAVLFAAMCVIWGSRIS